MGEGLTVMFSISDPVYLGQLRGSCIDTFMRSYILVSPLWYEDSGSMIFLPNRAAISYAVPITDKQSGRFGVSSVLIIESDNNSLIGVPVTDSSSNTNIPPVSSPIPSSRAEQIIPLDSIPRILAPFKISCFPDLGLKRLAPSFAKTIFCPTSKFGAPQTTLAFSPFPRSRVGSLSRSAFGCCSNWITWATTKDSESHLSPICSIEATSKPAIVNE